MICKNCSAQVDKTQRICPYCGSENFDIAKKEQDDYIKEFGRKKRKLRHIPEKFVNKTSKILLYLAAGIFVCILLAIAVVAVFSKATKGDILENQEKELAKLEEYYAAGEYNNMCNYMENIRRRGGKYEKYDRIANLYRAMDWKIEALQLNPDFIKNIDLPVSDVEDDIERCILELARIREMEEADFPYGEKDGALYIKNEYMSALVKYAFLTEEEIENAVDIYSEEGTDYTFLAEVSIQRMEEAFR